MALGKLLVRSSVLGSMDYIRLRHAVTSPSIHVALFSSAQRVIRKEIVMNRNVLSIAASLLVGCIGNAAFAAPISLDAAQLDMVNAGSRYGFTIQDSVAFLNRGSAVSRNLAAALPGLLAEATRSAPVAAGELQHGGAFGTHRAPDGGNVRMAATAEAPAASNVRMAATAEAPAASNARMAATAEAPAASNARMALPAAAPSAAGNAARFIALSGRPVMSSSSASSTLN